MKAVFDNGKFWRLGLEYGMLMKAERLKRVHHLYSPTRQDLKVKSWKIMPLYLIFLDKVIAQKALIHLFCGYKVKNFTIMSNPTTKK